MKQGGTELICKAVERRMEKHCKSWDEFWKMSINIKKASEKGQRKAIEALKCFF